MNIGELWSIGYFFSETALRQILEEEAQLQPPIILGLLGAILAFAVLIPYLLGSINSAVVISRLLYHDDVRNHGSGNAGTTNMLRTYGKVAALLTLLGDVLKTVLAVCIGSFTLSAAIGGWIAAFFCMIGHIFPLYYRFRGGKGASEHLKKCHPQIDLKASAERVQGTLTMAVIMNRNTEQDARFKNTMHY